MNTKEGPADQTWVGMSEKTPRARTAFAWKESLAGEETGSCDLLGGSGQSAEGGLWAGAAWPTPLRQGREQLGAPRVHLNCHSTSQQSLSCVQYAFPFKKKKNQRNILKVNRFSFHLALLFLLLRTARRRSLAAAASL